MTEHPLRRLLDTAECSCGIVSQLPAEHGPDCAARHALDVRALLDAEKLAESVECPDCENGYVTWFEVESECGNCHGTGYVWRPIHE